MSTRVTVTLTDAQAERAEEAAGRLRSAGMEVEQVLGSLGMVTGSVADERRAGLEALDGVASVSVERVVQLPDPGSDIQ